MFAVSITGHAVFLNPKASAEQRVLAMRQLIFSIMLVIGVMFTAPLYADMPANGASWDTTYHPSSSFWSYKKMLSSAGTFVSHFIHEVPYDEGRQDELIYDMKARKKRSGSSVIGESHSWKKFGLRDDHDRDDFHFKKGKHYYNDDDSDDSDKFFDSDDSDSDSDFKNGPPPVVPEPASFLLFISGGSVIVYRRYVKNKRSPTR